MPRKTLVTEPKHEHLDDELLSTVHGGGHVNASGRNAGNQGHGNGTGGGDGLGWLRNFIRAVDRALRF